ncbi:hypothetical protein SD70_16955 [Gordoniibacillus kamchatkensis]|uniref:DinB-like domain-containing protein n=1 Tax=Gordoniibacillus kamchatkensis TaxID=1590651 RepID=A0ABR5AFT1_9BACL|nr:DinB family protein [Paenibacillus sp. VKM B-2647]KIL39915.1 hypothetical protein SD70_16955 [Paenibacillus sp. VKM B-2647]
MNRDQLLVHVDLVRAITLAVFDTLDEAQADVQPDGFPNTIRWNLGHILITQEQLAVNFAGMQPQLPASYLKLFGSRTRPSEWTVQPPSLAEIKERLAAQPAYVREHLGDRLAEQVKKPFVRLGFELATIGQILLHSLYHEGLHQGAIGGLRKAISGQRA